MHCISCCCCCSSPCQYRDILPQQALFGSVEHLVQIGHSCSFASLCDGERPVLVATSSSLMTPPSLLTRPIVIYMTLAPSPEGGGGGGKSQTARPRGAPLGERTCVGRDPRRVCVFVCMRANAHMWYLACVRGRPQRRSMLTRRAAGPPDVPVPTRLVARGPLLLSLPCTRMHIHTNTHRRV